VWPPPDQGQRQRPDRADSQNYKGCSEIPLHLFTCTTSKGGGIQKLTAVFALYRVVLNIFSAEGTFFHYLLFGRTVIRLIGGLAGLAIGWILFFTGLFPYLVKYVDLSLFDSPVIAE
jgi:hypothetical protein